MSFRMGQARSGSIRRHRRNLRGSAKERRLQAESGPGSTTWSQLPESMLSGSVNSAFVDPDFRVWEEAPSCKGVRPPPELDPSRYRLGINYTSEQIVQGYRRKLPMRAMIWTARSGLGNSVQGLVCSFIFSILSARQFLVSTGGIYGATFDTVALGFEFPVDRTAKSVPRVPIVGFHKPGVLAMNEGAPVLQGNPREYYDDWWYATGETRQCVMQAFQCQDLWCVRSRVVNLILGKPTRAMGTAIRHVIRFDPPAEADEGRGRRRMLESNAREEGLGGEEGKEGGPLRGFRGAARSRAMGGEQEGGGAAARPGYTKKGARRQALERQGDRGAEAALRLKFDIAVHVRAVHKCTEGFSRLPGCEERGLAGAMEALELFPKMRPLLSLQRWGCMSQLLGFLLQLKIRRRREQGARFRGLFHSTVDEEELNEFLHEKHRRQALNMSRTTTPSDSPLVKYSYGGSLLWKIEDAEEIARRAKEAAGVGGGAEGELAILLATDAEALRPLLVKYLRPFGVVAYSAAEIMHLAHSGGDDSTRLGNLAEYYLMSRASVIVSYKTGRSSYARAAALYGNSTLVFGGDRLQCKFPVEHVARPME